MPIDHVGFSLSDLDAKMKELEAAGAKVTTPAREVPGLFKMAFVEDPWGTRIEVVQDPRAARPAPHAPPPARTQTRRSPGSSRTSAGRKRSSRAASTRSRTALPGFSDMWILDTKGEAQPSIGHAIDHIGWRSTKPLARNDEGADRERGARRPASRGPCRCPPGRRSTSPTWPGPQARGSSWSSGRA